MDLSIINEYTKNFGSVLWYALGGGEPFIRSDLYRLYEKVKLVSSKSFHNSN